jgi:2-keto-4-pentenoate hydratase/2-oxohepta-3-ene-1,7-dioic acid hydratase in catechol pathway
MEKNQYQEARELQSDDFSKKSLALQASSLPTSPPVGVTYHTLDWYGDKAKVCLWLSDDRLYLYAEPISTTEFFLCSSSFSVRQNEVL